jgi:carbonic anhydrase
MRSTTVEELVQGFIRFRETAYPERTELFHQLAHTQSPKVLFIACSDSRVVPELVTQSEPGAMFVIRNAGNIVPPSGPEPGGVSATIEYAVSVLGVSDIVICGHSDCGAMTAIAHEHDLSGLPAVQAWLGHASAAQAVNATRGHTCNAERLHGLIHENVSAQLLNLRTHSSVAQALARGKLRLHGWVFDIETGDIETLDGTSGRFVALEAESRIAAYPAH